MNPFRFVLDVLKVSFHFCREKYYGLALSHIGHDHPHSFLLTMRMIASRTIVNDFLRKRI